MENCGIRIEDLPNVPIIESLKKDIPNDNERLVSTIVYVLNDDFTDFNDKFLEFYKEKYNLKTKPNLKTGNAAVLNKIKQAAIEYANKKKPRITTKATTGTDRVALALYNYTNHEARTQGQRFVSNYILDAFKADKIADVKVEGNKVIHYLNKARNLWLTTICKRAAAELKQDARQLYKQYTELKTIQEKRDFVSKILGGNTKTEQNQNFYGVWCELNLNNNDAIAYINDLFNDPLLNLVLDDVSRDLDEINAEENLESNPDLNNLSPDDYEGALVDMDSGAYDYDHSGVKTSFMKHVTDYIQVYFNTLPKLIGNAYDTDNYYGLPTRMSANECSQFMYGMNEEFDNIPSMIEAIKQAATNVPKFNCFTKFANDLETDLDFANEVFRRFALPKYTGIEVRVEGDSTTTDVSNKRVSKEASMTFDFMNNLKASIINNPVNNMETRSKEIRQLLKYLSDTIGQYKQDKELVKDKLKNEKDKVKAAIIQLVKLYFPSAETDAIRNYIELNNNANTDPKIFYQNCLNIMSIMDSIIDKQQVSVDAYNTMQANLKAVREHNDRLNEEKRIGTNWVPASEYKSESEYKTDDFINIHKSFIRQLVTLLKPYSVGNIVLNDRNIHGNNQSAILNSSWISGIKHLTDKFYTDEKGKLRNDELQAWGVKKLINTSQYRYSSMLVEQTDEKGNVLNKDTAIFRFVNGTVELTKNADKILKIMVFNGASNMNDGSNMSYTKMTSGDYLPTSYMMFFTTKNNGLPIATYFPKVPSDAPNAFTIQSVVHDASNMLIIKDPEALESNVREMIENTVSLISVEEFQNEYYNKPQRDKGKSYIEIEDSKIVNAITKSKDYINNDDAIKAIGIHKSGEDYEAYVTFKTKSGITIIKQGTVTNKGKNLINSEVVGIVDYNINTGESYKELPELVTRSLADYYVKELDKHEVLVGEIWYNKTEYKVDTNHPVYKIVRNQFKQEILDGFIAASHYFRMRMKEDGSYEIIREKDKNDVSRVSIKDGIDITRGYRNYHIKNGKVITYDDKNKTYHLTGDVFHSTNFTISKKDNKGIETKINYLERLIDESTNPNDKDGTINFLYGGAHRIICDSEGKVIDIEFSDKQLEEIDKAMSEYLMDYIARTEKEILDRKKFIKNVATSKENITNYAINNLIMQYNFDYILDGSPKFYKSNQDVIKRVKQYQGSGSPYGSADYSATFVPNVAEATHSFLNNGTISQTKTVNGKKVTENVPVSSILDQFDLYKGVRQRNGYYAVTIENTKRTNHKALEQLKEKLIKECGVSPEHADEMLYGPEEIDKNTKEKVRTKGYQGTKVNDAQSYITIQEFIRRLSAKGQLKRYLPLLKKIADETQPISAKDISEFIQVQKNFYYDLFYDDRYGIEVPRQIKNAEFVLIPRFIRGTQLYAVYEAMQKAGIDQLNTVETSKAANEKILRIWDDNAEFDDKVLEQFVKDASQDKQIFSYNNLYTQQETPQHMDAENKAGIQVMKKMVDNIPAEGHPLSQLKKDFFATYSTNIQQSCVDLMRRLEVPVDPNGNIELDNDGKIERYNSRVLYERMLEEARRTGVDDNQKDYFDIPKGQDIPRMMSYNNSYLTKFESVFQSMFNAAITRQRLPGFHAAQITNIGFKHYGDEGLQVSYSKELRYHPDGKPFIEVIVPYKALGIDKNSEHYKGMTDEEILNELEAEGLLEFIGYRIPTEGKQSMAIMRVVGFLDDSQGSTIVVPDDWVSQTGSDFDIDSVYTILHEHEVDKTGKITKVKYKEAYNRTAKDYYNYLKYYLDKGSDKASAKVKESINKFKEDLEKDTKELKAKSDEAYYNLPKDQQDIIKEAHDYIKKHQNKELNDREKYLDLLKKTAKRIKANIKNLDKFPTLKAFAELNEQLADSIENFEERIINERKAKYNKLAEDNNLLTFEEFLDEENDLIANTKKARNSRIADIFLDILRAPESLEENLSRSNFDKISEAKKAKTDPNILVERENRNPHHIFDQVSYQEEVMSGRTLKGMSVALDTMCSVCNTVRPTLEEGITIIYNADEIDADVASEAFDCKVNKSKKTIKVEHHNYGWSKNNKSIEGYILTSDSSQTTAYILDNVKEGSLINCNSFTFPVWKTLANIGCNYGTSISFIAQPAITEIVKLHNAKNSVFNKGYGDEIEDAIRNTILNLYKFYDADSATEYYKHVSTENIKTLLKEVNDKFKDKINEIFKYGDKDVVFSMHPESLANIPIVSKLLDDRIHKTGIFTNPNSEESALFDLGVILTFSRLQGIAGRIGKIARTCTPDKFGAKQTVYSTRKLFDDILDCIYKEETVFKDNDDGIDIRTARKTKKHILTVNGNHMLEAIYPGVANQYATKDKIIENIVRNGDVNSSVYPPLYSFLKYSTAVSTILAKKVFQTQESTFTEVIEHLGQTFSGVNKQVPEDVYNDFQRYLLTSIYKNARAIKYPVTVRKVDGKIVLDIPEMNDDLAKDETSRIWGFGRNTDLSTPVEEIHFTKTGKQLTRITFKEFKVKDITEPTEDELEDFEKLSPAQKVYFIQSNFLNAEIFDLLQVNLYDSRSRGKFKNAQRIEYIDENHNPNDIYNMFRRAFESDNPLIVSAAIDIIKYGVQVEGLNMSSRAVNKVIDNDALINDFNDNGLGFVFDCRTEMRNFGSTKGNCSTNFNIQDTYQNYLRTVPDNIPIRTLYLTDSNILKYKIYRTSYSTLRISIDKISENADENIKAFDAKLKRIGIKYSVTGQEKLGVNKYIQVQDDAGNKLMYKIHDLGSQVILTPLSKLEANENTVWSANAENNDKYLSPYGYQQLINSYRLVAAEEEFNKATISKIVKDLVSKHKPNKIKFKETGKNIKRKANPTFNIEKLIKEDNGKAINLKDDIIKHFSDLQTETLYVNNALISENLFTAGEEYGTVQTITFPNSDKHQFLIYIPKEVHKWEKAFLNPKEGNEKLSTKQIPNSYLKDIITNYQQTNFKYLSNLAIVKNVDSIGQIKEITDNEDYNATVEDKIVDVMSLATSVATNAGEETHLSDFAYQFKNNLYANDIVPTRDSVKENKLLAWQETAAFTIKSATYLREQMIDRFMEDPDRDDAYIPITDPRVLDYVSEDAYLMDKYMQVCNMVTSFLQKTEPLINETSEDRQIQGFIDDIRIAINNNLQDVPIQKLQTDLGNRLLKDKSTNPLVQQNYIDVLDGFWKTYGSMWNYFSIMENGTPILQTILSDVMTNIDAQQRKKHKYIKEYRDGIDAIIERAKQRGETIDINKLIDTNGNWINNFIQKFAEDLEELRLETHKYPLGSVQHLEAKLKLDEFLLNHVHREVTDDYYREKLAIEKELFETIPELYSEYMKLFYRRQEIFNYANTDDLTEELKEELQDINGKMANLYLENGYIDESGTYQPRYTLEEFQGKTLRPEFKHHLKLYSKESARFLGEHLERLNKLNEDIFENKELLGFKRTLKHYQNIIERLEHRVNGIPTVDQATLNTIPEYVKAVNWIKENAYFKLNIEYNPNNEPVTLGARLFKAFKYLGRSKRNVPKNIFLEETKFKDHLGIIDGRKLDSRMVANVKASDIAAVYPVTTNGTVPALPIDRILISNRKPENAKFSNVFYKKLSGNSNTTKGINYYQTITKLNKLLEPLLGAIDGEIHFERLKDNPNRIQILNEIANLYNELVHSGESDYNADGEYHGEGVSDFIKNEVEFITNKEAFERTRAAILAINDDEFTKAMFNILYITNRKGEYVKDSDGNFVPNRYLFSYAKPKGKPDSAHYKRYVSQEETEARALIDKYYEIVTTEYYEYTKEEAIKNNNYDEWYDQNHYYNPFTRKMTPISCWTQSRIKTKYFANNELQGKWFPKIGQKERKVKTGITEVIVNGKIMRRHNSNEDKRNHDYNPNGGRLGNYKIGSGYDSGVSLNQSEQEMLSYLKETLNSTAKTKQAKKFLQKSAPIQAKSNASTAKKIVKEIGKSIGVGLTENNGYSEFRKEIDYAYDEETPMPMLADLHNANINDLEKKLKELKELYPKKEENETDEEFTNRLKDYNNEVNKLKEDLKKERSAITDNNWYDVIENYLSRATDYNAVQDNKNKLYFLLNILRDMKMYSRKYGSYGELKKQRTNADGSIVYETSVDKNLIEQYENFLRRFLFNEWKEPEGIATSIGNILQGFASANYMMLNVRGGFANVTLGETGILAEAFAKDYIGKKDWGFGTAEYIKGITGYSAAAYHYAATGKRKAYNKQNAIIESFNVVDYDESTGVLRNADMSHYAEQVRNFMFSPQTIGEHFMQNSVLFAVLHSHKIFDTEQGVMAMNKNQYIAYRQMESLMEILDEEQLQRFNEFKDKIKANKDELAKYAWFRRDALTRFIYLHCSKEQNDEFKRKTKELRKQFEDEFDNGQNIYDQLDINKEGEMIFVAGSELDNLNRIKANALGDITEAEQLVARLAEKTRKINNKIHGIYNKREAAHIESKWYGGLVMQYHKHIPMGLLKRYMARGHWNEFRNSVDKGMIQSVIDFMALNIEKVQTDLNFTKEEATALQSFMFNFTHSFKMLSQLRATWDIIPDYEKANILRNTGDLFGTIAALGTTAALWAIADDENPEGFWFNFLLYESDRLASEAFMYNPYGMAVEGKKLMSTPIAAGSIINDAMNLMIGTVNWMFDEEYNPYYESGRFAGEHKFSVYIQRRIPIWNGIRNLIDIEDNNKFYKVAANPLGLFDVKENVLGK